MNKHVTRIYSDADRFDDVSSMLIHHFNLDLPDNSIVISSKIVFEETRHILSPSDNLSLSAYFGSDFCDYADVSIEGNGYPRCAFSVSDKVSSNLGLEIEFSISDPTRKLLSCPFLEIEYVKSNDYDDPYSHTFDLGEAFLNVRELDGRMRICVPLVGNAMPIELVAEYDPGMTDYGHGMPHGWRLTGIPYLDIDEMVLYAGGSINPLKQALNRNNIWFSRGGTYIVENVPDGFAVSDAFGNRIACLDSFGMPFSIFIRSREIEVTMTDDVTLLEDWLGNSFECSRSGNVVSFRLNGIPVSSIWESSPGILTFRNIEGERRLQIGKYENFFRMATQNSSSLVLFDANNKVQSVRLFHDPLFQSLNKSASFVRDHLAVTATTYLGVTTYGEYDEELRLTYSGEVKNRHRIISSCYFDGQYSRPLFSNGGFLQRHAISTAPFIPSTYGASGYLIHSFTIPAGMSEKYFILDLQISNLMGSDAGGRGLSLVVIQDPEDGIRPVQSYSIVIKHKGGKSSIVFFALYGGSDVCLYVSAPGRNEPIRITGDCYETKVPFGGTRVWNGSGNAIDVDIAHWRKESLTGISTLSNHSSHDYFGIVREVDLQLNAVMLSSMSSKAFINDGDDMIVLEDGESIVYKGSSLDYAPEYVSCIYGDDKAWTMTMIVPDYHGFAVQIVNHAAGISKVSSVSLDSLGRPVISLADGIEKRENYLGQRLVSFDVNASESAFYQYDFYDRVSRVVIDAPWAGKDRNSLAYSGSCTLPSSTSHNGFYEEYNYSEDYLRTASIDWETSGAIFGYGSGVLLAVISSGDVLEIGRLYGRIASISVNGIPLASYTYGIQERTYRDCSTQAQRTSIYDEYGRLVEVVDGESEPLFSIYRSGGSASSITSNNPFDLDYNGFSPVKVTVDHLTGKRRNYFYSDDGLLSSVFEYIVSTGCVTGNESYEYDEHKRLSGEGKTYNLHEWHRSFEYDAYGRVCSICESHSHGDGYVTSDSSRSFDHLQRISGVETSIGDICVSTVNSYHGNTSFVTSRQTSYSTWHTSESIQYAQNGKIFRYMSNSSEYTFDYDIEGRIISANMRSSTISPVIITTNYDQIGRISSISRSGLLLGSSRTLQYDLHGRLSSIDGFNISYQGSLPTTWKDMSLSWGGESRLVGASFSGCSISFEYDFHGRRVSKTVGNVRHDYYWHDEKLIREIITGPEQINILYFYDVVGSVCGMAVNGVRYSFVKNVFGDVVRIINQTGNTVASYEYDIYGLQYSFVSGIGALNPFRYRGYYYDVETGLYWLSSRYYDPEIGRFISPDSVDYLDPTSINGLNLYAYCNNDPVNFCDPSGHNPSPVAEWFSTIFGFFNPLSALIGIGAIVIAACQGRWNEVVQDWNNGCFNPFNQDENIAVNSKVFAFYCGEKVVRQSCFESSLQVFGTIFLHNDQGAVSTLNHEFGHGVQEKMIGPLYLLRIALPSMISFFRDPTASAFDYYSQPWERTADIFGGVNRKSGYKTNSDIFGWLYLVFGCFILKIGGNYVY